MKYILEMSCVIFFYLVGISNYFSLGYVVKIFLCYKLHCT